MQFKSYVRDGQKAGDNRWRHSRAHRLAAAAGAAPAGGGAGGSGSCCRMGRRWLFQPWTPGSGGGDGLQLAQVQVPVQAQAMLAGQARMWAASPRHRSDERTAKREGRIAAGKAAMGDQLREGAMPRDGVKGIRQSSRRSGDCRKWHEPEAVSR